MGGKLGERICTELNVQHMAELLQFSKDELQRRYEEKNGQWLYNLARGIDLEHTVKPRLVPKSISCSKMFPRQNAIKDLTTLKHWLQEIAQDVVDRVEEDELDNNRRAKQMVVSFTQTINNKDVSYSRTVTITAIDNESIVNDAINVIKKNTKTFFKPGDVNSLNNSIKLLGFNVCRFESLNKPNKTIGDLFSKGQKTSVDTVEMSNISKNESNSEDSVKTQKCNNDIGDESIPFLPERHFEFHEDDVDDSFDEEIGECLKTNVNISPNLFESSPDTPIPSTSFHSTNVQNDHVEIDSRSETIKCGQCGKMIDVSEIQIHADGHLAFLLNQEQRSEFQQNLKRPHISKTPVKKKQKTVTQTSSEKTSIFKYLVKEKSPNSSATKVSGIETEKCTECGKEISVTDLIEHMDFHMAKRLQNEFMKTEKKLNLANNSDIKKPNNSNNKSSIGKNKKSDGKSVKNPAVRNITAFFQNIH